MIKKENVIQLIKQKIFVLALMSALLAVIFYFLEYSLENYLINTFLIYISSWFFYGLLCVSSFDLFSVDDLFDEEVTDEEEAQELERLQFELDYNFPKLRTYNKIILHLSLTIKLVSILIFIYGSSVAVYDMSG